MKGKRLKVILGKDNLLECGGECSECERWACRAFKSGGELVMVKKRVSTKYVPPDSSLLRAISLEEKEKFNNKDLSVLDEHELDRLEKELIELFKAEDDKKIN